MKRVKAIASRILSNVTAVLSDFISKLCRPELVIQDKDVYEIKAIIKSGDILCTRLDYELSNVVEKWLTGSFYGHAAIYLNGKVYEAGTKGVRCTSLEMFCYMKDGIGVGRIKGANWSESQINEMEWFCKKQLGDKYDYSFSWGAFRKWYCSKLVYMAIKHVAPTMVKSIPVSDYLGQEKVPPQNLWNGIEHVGQWGVTK